MRGLRLVGRFLLRRGADGRGRLSRPRWGRGVLQARLGGIVVFALVMPPSLSGGGSSNGRWPLPTVAGVRADAVRLADWVMGKTPAEPVVPAQASGSVPGRQHPVPASVTRAIARARGYKPSKGAGGLPAYAFPAAKVTQHVTGPAEVGGAASFSPAASKPMASGSTSASQLYQNPDGSFTRLQYPQRAPAGHAALTFPTLPDTGVKGARVTSVALRVREALPALGDGDRDRRDREAGGTVGRPSAGVRLRQRFIRDLDHGAAQRCRSQGS